MNRLKMKAMLLLVMFALTMFGIQGKARAAGYTTNFTTSITYQNVGSATANIDLAVYAAGSGTSAVSIQQTLAANGATSINVGSLGQLSSGFKGSATLSADQPLVATLVQLPQAPSDVTNRPLSSGFSAGAQRSLIATVLKNTFNTSTKFSVQNVGSSATTIAIKFYNTSNVLVHAINTPSLPANSSYFVDAGTVTELGAAFNGSVVAEAATGGSIVSTAMELGTTTTVATAFEGVADGSGTVYLATALCNIFGGQSTFYAVQNAGTTSTDVTVTYSGGGTQTKTIAAGSKASFATCDVKTANYTGSATMTTSSGGKIIVVGKMVVSGGMQTAFVGAASGAAKLALPYVRYSTTRFDAGDRARQRTNIAIQNIGGTTASNVTVKYYDRDGLLVGTHTIASIAAGAKANSNPSLATLTPGYAGGTTLAEFGYYTAGTGGGTIIESTGSSLIAVARVQSAPTTGIVAEDYSATPIQ